MRTTLDHLPPAKQRELERVVRILFEEFASATAIATADWKRRARILKVILYGSYAHGGWVDKPHTAKGYQSDFDLLIIVDHDKLTDRVEFWSAAEDRLKGTLRKAGERTLSGVWFLIGKQVDLFQSRDALTTSTHAAMIQTE